MGGFGYCDVYEVWYVGNVSAGGIGLRGAVCRGELAQIVAQIVESATNCTNLSATVSPGKPLAAPVEIRAFAAWRAAFTA